jgi:hypothetical protein
MIYIVTFADEHGESKTLTANTDIPFDEHEGRIDEIIVAAQSTDPSVDWNSASLSWEPIIIERDGIVIWE